MSSKFTIIIPLLVLTACANNSPSVDRFAIMAEEWQGAHIEEMIAIWGEGRSYQSPDPEAGVDTGYVYWIYEVRPNNSPGSAGKLTRCETTAHFGADGVIYSIETVTRNCGKLTRPSYHGPDFSRR